MSMTIIAFINKAKIPSKLELEAQIRTLGYNFKFNENFNLFDEFGGDCELNGQKTFIEVYFIKKEELDDLSSLDEDLESYDSAFSFIWGADSIAGACISIISVALIDLCNSKILFEDFEVWYDREKLLNEIPMFLEEKNTSLRKVKKIKLPVDKKNKIEKITNIIIWSLLVITTILMNRKIISWHIPSLVLAFILIKSIIETNKK
ncbi:hypothetical protein [Gelidibacter salicanalis]|uniref:Uncharacterized protein n=1 Tax=Gelidibacter salicanalis TaxID=291193 RepID=A0A934KRZ7_9FLAO|nr:hypothetical protein [Gelidibacter salicanalis]MBJ7880985.1 hypothetical protein [Gelidibacter salicanalis]